MTLAVISSDINLIRRVRRTNIADLARSESTYMRDITFFMTWTSKFGPEISQSRVRIGSENSNQQILLFSVFIENLGKVSESNEAVILI